MEKLYKNITNLLLRHSYKSGFGQYVENSMHMMTNDTLPVRTSATIVRMNAHLSTNESIDDTFTIDNNTTNPLDGYIIGVGFGHVFKMIDLFSKNTLPRAIICVDVQPEVILVGRIIVQKLIKAKNKKNFFTSLYTVSRKEIDSIVTQEQHAEIAERLREAIPYTEKLFNNVSHHIEIGAYLTPSILELFNRNFSRFQQLARNNNIGVVFIDITNTEFIETIKKLPCYSTSRNIIYLSNAIDHITHRGIDREAINALDVLHTLDTSRGSICVDTTQQSLNYILRIGTLPPKYSMSDYPNQL